MTITMAITMTPALFCPLEVSRVHFTKREGKRKKKEKRMRTNTVVWKGKNERKKINRYPYNFLISKYKQHCTKKVSNL